MAEYRVNVVFHGVFGFVLESTHIEVLCPYIGLHEYLFGCWEDLSPWGKGSYTLSGLEGSRDNRPRPDFDPARNPTVRGFSGRNLEMLYSSVRLDYPDDVSMYRDYTYGKEILPFGGIHGLGLQLTNLVGPVVFGYRTKSLQEVALMSRGVKMLRDIVPQLDKPDTLNLHFFAEGENDLPCVCDPDYLYQVGMHYSESWGKLTSLISGLDLRLAKIKPFVAGGSQNPPIGNLPHGLPSVQLRDLDELYRAKHPCRQCGNSGAFG